MKTFRVITLMLTQKSLENAKAEEMNAMRGLPCDCFIFLYFIFHAMR